DLVSTSSDGAALDQIRVHTQHAGHPIACDDKYGETGFDEKMRGQGLKRLFLHAWKLTFTHPVDEREMQVEAPLSPELEAFLAKLPR
ncbi:MAG: 23S rRNA pseudouridine(955/2504/2580) synthase, partial [Pseudorhodobacter sp.]